MSLAIFDLDNTLIADDSDYLWGQFLVDRGIVDKDEYEQANAKFYDDYKRGTLDIVEFLQFSLRPLSLHHPEQLHQWRTEFVEQIIRPLLLKPAIELVARHKNRGDTLLVITATNRFVTEPIVELFGIPDLLATTPEFRDGRYTGNFIGLPCFREGKVAYLEKWLQSSNQSLHESWFYSDSHNDLPLLNKVENPVAVDPDDILRQHAELSGWPVISLRNGVCPSDHLHK